MSGNTNNNKPDGDIFIIERPNSQENKAKERQSLHQEIEIFYKDLFDNAIQENYEKYVCLKQYETKIQKHILKLTEKLEATIRQYDYFKETAEIYFTGCLNDFLLANVPPEEKERRKDYLNIIIQVHKKDKAWLEKLEIIFKPIIPIEPQQKTLDEQIFEALKLNLENEKFRYSLMFYLNNLAANLKEELNWENRQTFIEGANKYATQIPKNETEIPKAENFQEILRVLYQNYQKIQDLRAAQILMNLNQTGKKNSNQNIKF